MEPLGQDEIPSPFSSMKYVETEDGDETGAFDGIDVGVDVGVFDGYNVGCLVFIIEGFIDGLNEDSLDGLVVDFSIVGSTDGIIVEGKVDLLSDGA
jgi:hypothetical protein